MYSNSQPLTDQQIQLIQRLAKEAQQRPQWYRAKLVALAVLGYAYIGLVAMVALGITVGVVVFAIVTKSLILLKVYLKFIWAPVALLALLVRAFFLKVPPPQGHTVRARDFPGLFAEIENIRKTLRAPRIHQVLITHDYNAAVTSIPRLGLLGWPRHYLLLGMPLLMSLDKNALRAVLAHEFGHISRAHTRTGHWIYRVRVTWYQILDALEARQSASSKLFTWFFNWYAPYFNAYSFVLARQNEYEADECAARLTDVRTAARALTAVYSQSDYEQDFWNKSLRRSRNEAQPPTDIFQQLHQYLRRQPGEEVHTTIQSSLAQTTGYLDTHPALTDRLKALGSEAVAPDTTAASAATTLMQPNLDALLAEMNRHWVTHIGAHWQQQHAQYEEDQKSLRHLAAKAQHETLTAQEYQDLALSTQRLHDTASALPHFRQAAALAPDNADYHFNLGLALIAIQDDACETHLRRAAELKPILAHEALWALLNYVTEHRPQEDHQPYIQAFETANERYRQAAHERQLITTRDTILPHGLDDSTVRRLQLILGARLEIREAYLTRKQLHHFPDYPCFVLALKSSTKKEAFVKDMQDFINALPEHSTVVDFTHTESDALYKKLKKHKDCRLLKRKWRERKWVG